METPQENALLIAIKGVRLFCVKSSLFVTDGVEIITKIRFLTIYNWNCLFKLLFLTNLARKFSEPYISNIKQNDCSKYNRINKRCNKKVLLK
jgi:hypothetical protein